MPVSFRTSIVLWLPLSLALAGQTITEHNFNEEAVGASPAGFTFGSMRQAEPGRWTIQKRDLESVLFHERDASTGYSLAIAEGLTPPDIVVTVRLRLTEGARTGGLVWRYLDDRHYYSLVLDLAQGEVALYRIHQGHRNTLESEDGLELDPEAWHLLKVVHTGTTIRASLGGVRVFEDEDGRNRWPDQPSRVGLLATGNSAVEFDDLRIAPRSDRR
jgi:hypothetical protein